MGLLPFDVGVEGREYPEDPLLEEAEGVEEPEERGEEYDRDGVDDPEGEYDLDGVLDDEDFGV